MKCGMMGILLQMIIQYTQALFNAYLFDAYLFDAFFFLIQLLNLHQVLTCAISFFVNALWLAAFNYANHLFMVGYHFLFIPTSSGMQIGRKTRAGCTKFRA